MFRAWFGIIEVLAHRFHKSTYSASASPSASPSAPSSVIFRRRHSVHYGGVRFLVCSQFGHVYVQQIQRISTGLLLYCIVGIVKFSGERTFSGENSEGICDTGTYRIFSANKRYVSYKFPF
jgi:hypothetical protein